MKQRKFRPSPLKTHQASIKKIMLNLLNIFLIFRYLFSSRLYLNQGHFHRLSTANCSFKQFIQLREDGFNRRAPLTYPQPTVADPIAR